MDPLTQEVSPTPEPQNFAPQPPQQSYAIPIAIVIAGALIGLAIWYTGTTAKQAPPQQQGKTTASVDKARAVNPATDHIEGSASAPVTLIEYADLECPFCKDYHKVIDATLPQYIANGQVRHVYRHLPLSDLHPRAVDEAIAAECVARIAGNNTFWKYIDAIFAVTPSNNKLDPEKLVSLASGLGVNVSALATCRAGTEARALVEKDVNDALAGGATGTPYTILIAADGTRFPYSGTMSTAQLEDRIKAAIALKK